MKEAEAPGSTEHQHERAPKPAASPSEDTGGPPSRTDPVIVFALRCLRGELASLTARVPADGGQPDPEGIHQMRIAVRRIRVALTLFDSMLPADDVANFKSEFRWLSHALGEVRDLDVLAEDLRSYGQSLPGANAENLGGYELSLRRARMNARAGLGSLLSGERYARLVSSFAEFVAREPSPPALRRWRSFRVCDGAPRFLEASVKRTLKRGRKTGRNAPAERLHRLRISAKRLRYELEFFAGLYPDLNKAVKATKRLQDVLGEYQDACTANERLRTYALDAPDMGARNAARAARPFGLGQLMHKHDQTAQRIRQRFPSEWRRFEQRIARKQVRALLTA